MSFVLDVDGLGFRFDAGVVASKYDEWQFYKKRVMGAASGIKAVDILAVRWRSDNESDDPLWLVEAKDYRSQSRCKPSDLAEEVAAKVLHTLGGLAAARATGAAAGRLADLRDTTEHEFAVRALQCARYVAVLVVLLPSSPSRLHQGIEMNVDLKLRQRLHGIARTRVVKDLATIGPPWSVQEA